jgi:hypothetical protein
MNTLNNANSNIATNPSPNLNPSSSFKQPSPPSTLILPQPLSSLAHQTPSSLSGVGGSGGGCGGTNTLNNLKYKFEHLQNHPISSSTSATCPSSTRSKTINASSVNNSHLSVNNSATLPSSSSTQLSQQFHSTLSFSSSSSLSNFSLSPSSSSSSSSSSSTSTCNSMANARSSLVQNQLNILNNKSNANNNTCNTNNGHASIFKRHNDSNTSRFNSNVEPTTTTTTTTSTHSLKPIVYRQQKSELHNIPNTNANNNTSNKRQTFTSSTTTLLPNNDENNIYSQNSPHVTNMPSTSAVSPKTPGSIQINEKTTMETAKKSHLSGEIPVLKGENSNLVMQNNSNTNTNINNWVPMKNHSVKCNIMLKKMRRGNKRSKSLPAKFR